MRLADDTVLVRSALTQGAKHTENQRRQYALAETARAAGFGTVGTINDDLGRSGAGLVDRPGFLKLVAPKFGAPKFGALVCAGTVGAIYCIEASRLARGPFGKQQVCRHFWQTPDSDRASHKSSRGFGLHSIPG